MRPLLIVIALAVGILVLDVLVGGTVYLRVLALLLVVGALVAALLRRSR